MPVANEEEPAPQLSELLDEAQWRPEQLARRVNQELNPGRGIHEKTPYGWLKGKVPRAAVAEAAARAFSARLNRRVEVRSIWPDLRLDDDAPLPANDGLVLPWSRAGLHQLAADWERMQRRRFLTLSGAALTAPAWESLEEPVPDLSTDHHAGQVDEPTLRLIEQNVEAAQRLDDAHGSSAVRYVIDSAGAVARMLDRDSYDRPAGRRLAAALAQLSQTAGFMASEARSDALGQRLYLAGVRASHAAGDPALTASILALMSNQATALGQVEDALQLAAAAQTAAAESPCTVRALIAARAALAYAAVGDSLAFEHACNSAQTLLEVRDSRPAPRWCYYFDSTELEAIMGRGMVALARRLPAPRVQRRLLERAEPLLRPRAFSDQAEAARSAFRHSAWLALGYSSNGDLDQALVAGRRALGLLPEVASARTVGLLQRLNLDLKHRGNHSPDVKEFLADLVPKVSSAA